MEEAKTTQVTVRLTKEERDKIKKSAQKARQTESGYIRAVVLGKEDATLPEEIEKLLKDLLDKNLAAGQEINQAARALRMKGSYSRSDYLELTRSLEKMNENYLEMSLRIREVVR